MTDQEVTEKIKKYIVDMFGVEADKLNDDNVALVQDLGLDSIDIIDILTQIREDFGLDLYPQDFEGCSTLGQFTTTVRSKYRDAQ